MKNVLFIVYYFPPMGGSGVQRPLKFIKYLPKYGWNPIVVTPEPGMYHTFDTSLADELSELDVEIHRVKARTPFHMAGNKAREVRFIPDRIAGLVRYVSNFFLLPDNKIAWIKPAVEEIRNIISGKKIDVILSTAPPYSNHLIGAEIRKEFDIPLVLDFRDDWLENHLITYPSRFHKKKMAKIESECLQMADKIIALNDSMKISIESRLSSPVSVSVIPHGFDREDFAGKYPDKHPGKFWMMYSGLFYGENQPDTFLKAVDLALESAPHMREQLLLQFQGGLDQRHLSLIAELSLTDITRDFGYVKHEEAIQNLINADTLWFIVGHKRNYEKVTIGKMYEYMATKKPILALIREGAAAKQLREYGASYIVNPENTREAADKILEIWDQWGKKSFPVTNSCFVAQYDREKLTEGLADVFNALSFGK